MPSLEALSSSGYFEERRGAQEIAQRKELPVVAGFSLEHTSRHKLAEDHASGCVGSQEIERIRVANPEALEEGGHRVPAQHALLGHEAVGGFGRCRRIGQLEGLLEEGLLRDAYRGPRGDAERGQDGQRRDDQQQSAENELVDQPEAGRALR